MALRPLRVCVTGAGGLISYSLVPMIAAGSVFGPNQPVIITALDIEAPNSIKGLNGLNMEMEDCRYPLVHDFIPTHDMSVAFKDVDYCLCAGAFPRGPGMERKDLLEKNAGIFREQGHAIRDHGKEDTRVVVVGNPANTNALLAQHFGGLNPRNVSALTRLDENRARNMIARKLGVKGGDVKNVFIWGNHSATQYPDTNHATVQLQDGTVKTVRDVLNHDDGYLYGPFIKDVQQRGAAVIATRGASSATSAAWAVAEHTRDWHLGTAEGEWASMAVWSDGNPYGIADGLMYSFPVTIKPGEGWEFVTGLEVDAKSRALMEASEKELMEEREAALKATQ